MKHLSSSILVMASGLHISALHCNSSKLSGILLISYTMALYMKNNGNKN